MDVEDSRREDRRDKSRPGGGKGQGGNERHDCNSLHRTGVLFVDAIIKNGGKASKSVLSHLRVFEI